MNNEMEFLRDILNKMITDGEVGKEELLIKSRELDKLILRSVIISKYNKTVLGSESMKEFEIIIDKLQLFEKMYQAMRIIDPISKKILEIKAESLQELDGCCYDIWNKNAMCDNCVSIRAYNEDDVIYKIEHNGSNIFMVTAVPISVQGRRLIVELLKNTTNSMYLSSGEHGQEIRILSSIEYMNEATVKDELTGLYNRRYINERLPTDLLYATLKKQPLSVIFADLDFFKAVNDKYGHSVGDKVLREFSEVLEMNIRSGKDWAARYGGEEFILCLPNTDMAAAKEIAERIRVYLMEKEFDAGDKRIQMTCSFGVHTFADGDKCLTVDCIIDAVDKKLYKAKSSGRNKVV